MLPCSISYSDSVAVRLEIMHTCPSPYSRSSLFSESKAVQSQFCPTSEQAWERVCHAHVSCCKDSSHYCLPGGNKDWHCPVCLQTAIFPVRTNCGHFFCAPCLIAYWKHGTLLGAINCPLCRQKVNVMCHLFRESRTDRQEIQVLGDIRDYNKRFSGGPRHVTDYLYDTPLMVHLLLRGLGNMGGLVWLFILRVTVCGFGAIMSLVPPLEATQDPFCGMLGLLDDLAVVFLLLISVININRQIEPQGAQIT